MSVNPANVIRCWICEFPANHITQMAKIKGHKVYLCSQECRKIFVKNVTPAVNLDPQKSETAIVIPKPRRFSEIDKKFNPEKK